MCVELKLPRAAARTVVLQRLRGAGSQRFVGRQHGVAHIDVAAGSVQVEIPGKGLAAGEVDGAGRDAQVPLATFCPCRAASPFALMSTCPLPPSVPSDNKPAPTTASVLA